MKVIRTLTVLTFSAWSIGFVDAANAQQLPAGEREARVTAIAGSWSSPRATRRTKHFCCQAM